MEPNEERWFILSILGLDTFSNTGERSSQTLSNLAGAQVHIDVENERLAHSWFESATGVPVLNVRPGRDFDLLEEFHSSRIGPSSNFMTTISDDFP